MADTSSTASSRSTRGEAVARSEQNGHFKTIKFHGLKLNLPGTVKLRLLRQLTDGSNEEMIAVVEELLGDQMEQVWDLDVDVTEGMDSLGVMLGDLSVAIFEAYGSSAGESQASPSPSKNTQARSRRTSSTTTD